MQLLAEAADVLRASEVTRVQAASGGSSYIWPGVPRDVPGAVAFFVACGWQHAHDVVDMIADLGSYQPPDLARQRDAQPQISLTRASQADTDEVLTFENSTFPSWVRWFQAAEEQILTAQDANAEIAGTLLFDGPSADMVFASMLGQAAARSDVLGSYRGCTDMGSAPNWSCMHRSYSVKLEPALATSAGPPGSRSTAGAVTSPGDVRNAL